MFCSCRCGDGRRGDHKVDSGHSDDVVLDMEADVEVNQEVDEEVFNVATSRWLRSLCYFWRKY